MQPTRRSLSQIKKTYIQFGRNLAYKKPDFVIIGAQKSGTTSLYHSIVQHPEIITASNKEIHYFCCNYSNGRKWYLEHFPYIFPWSKIRITGEATPEYMFLPWAADRLIDLLPKAKLIAILRNPVKRAISHYFHEIRRSPAIEDLPIMEALLAEEDRITIDSRQSEIDEWNDVIMLRRASYKRRGIYHEQIKRFDRYWRSGRLMVINSESFFEDPIKILQQVFSFLEVDPNFQHLNIISRNIGDYQNSISKEVYDYLEDYFKPYNQLLYDYIRQDFHW
jgi:hypothetical protein